MALLLAFGALIAGPLFWQLLQRRSNLHRPLGVVMAVVLAALIILIMMHTVEDGGLIALVFGVLGFLLPLAAERIMRRQEWTIHQVTLALGVVGLFLHNLSDGAALAAATMAGDSSGLALETAVVLHRLPMGLAVWWLVSTEFGNRLAIVSITLMALATLVGFYGGEAILGNLDEAGRAWFIAFVAGSLAHLAVHRLGGGHHDDHEGHHH